MEQNEQEIVKLAWKVYTEVLENIEIPDYVTINKNDDGTFSFTLIFDHKDIGSTSILFNPSIENIKDWLKNPELNKEKYIIRNATPGYGQAVYFAFLFLTNFFVEMEETLSNLLEFPTLIQQLLVIDLPSFENIYNGIATESSNKGLEEFLENKKRKLKEKILNEINLVGKVDRTFTHLIAKYYEDLLIEWEQAKRFYKRNKNFNNWDKMIAISFPDFPLDLINRLADPDKYAAMASSIALENAARFCGVKPNSVGLRTLQNYLLQSRKWMKSVGDEKVAEELKNYHTAAIEKVAITLQFSDPSINEEDLFEDDSFLYQYLVKNVGARIKEEIEKRRVAFKKNDESEENKLIH